MVILSENNKQLVIEMAWPARLINPLLCGLWLANPTQATLSAALHTHGYECFARREQEIWVGGVSLQYEPSLTEAQCRSSCSYVEGTHAVLYVRGTSECYCHSGALDAALPCESL